MTGLALLAPLAFVAPGFMAPGFASTSSPEAPTVLVVDASASMARPLAGGESRLSAVATAVAALEAEHAVAEAGLVTFGSNADRLTADSAVACNDAEVALRPVAPGASIVDDRPSHAETVRSLRPQGRSATAMALRTAANAVPASAPAHLVLVTDGTDDCAGIPVCERVGDQRAADPDLVVDVIAVGDAAIDSTRREHACIAAAGGGRYATAGSAAQLAAALRAFMAPASATAGELGVAGLDGIALGTTLADAAAIDPTLVASPLDATPVVAETRSAWIRFDEGVATEIVPKEAVPTSAGLAIGDDRADAVALYGEPVGSGSGDTGRYKYFATGPRSDVAYRVTFEDDRVTRITLVRLGATDAAREAGVADAAALPPPPPATSVDGLDVTPTVGGIGPIRIGMTEDELVAVAPGLSIWQEGGGGPEGWSRQPFADWRADNVGEDVCAIAGDLMQGAPHVLLVDGRVVAVTSKIVSPGQVEAGSSAVEAGAAFGAVDVESDGSMARLVVEGRDGTTLQLFGNTQGRTQSRDGGVFYAVGVFAADWTGRSSLNGLPCWSMDQR